MAVHRELRCGFLEPVSPEAFTIELEERRIPFVREARLPVRYRNRLLPVFYKVDFICYGEILVELKALDSIGPIEQALLINYLRAARRSRGLLLNFGAASFQHRRVVLDLSDDPVNRSSQLTSGGAAEPR
jgi:GxxExxY protein